jgi:RNA polymerase sigma-70 factor (ECF subfamily)
MGDVDTDEALAARARAGDGDAFGHLVERHLPGLRRLCRAVLLNADDADDAVQDGCLTAWRNLAAYDPARPFRPWLARVVLNAARDLRRKSRVRAVEELPETAATAGPSAFDEAVQAEVRERFARAVAALPERQRMAVTLFDVEGYAHAEIAALLGVPDGTVRSDLFHARRALRAALGPAYGPSREE